MARHGELGTGLGRPRVEAMPYKFRVCYDWLYLNHIDGWVPERPTILVDLKRGWLHVDCWRLLPGGDPWDPMDWAVTRPGNAFTVEQRRVPLLLEPDKHVCEAMAASGAVLIYTE